MVLGGVVGGRMVEARVVEAGGVYIGAPDLDPITVRKKGSLQHIHITESFQNT